jgi:hypothetical protein
MVAAPPPPVIAGASASPLCRGGGIPYPQAAVTTGGGAIWVACRDNGTLVRLRTKDGRVTRTIRLAGLRPWSVAFAGGRLWVIDRDLPLVAEVDPARARVAKRIALTDLPDVVAAAAGGIWIGYERSGAARVDLATRTATDVVAGDGVSGFASDGVSVWIVSHRDNRIHRVDRAGQVELLSTTLAPTTTAAAEHIAFAAGSLWVTGRGLDLLNVDPLSGAVRGTTEVGAAGIVVVASAGRLFVPIYTATGARRGDPLLLAVKTVDPARGRVTATLPAKGRILYAGLAPLGTRWAIADTIGGRLFRLRRAG